MATDFCLRRRAQSVHLIPPVIHGFHETSKASTWMMTLQTLKYRFFACLFPRLFSENCIIAGS
ncbi:hypothetical protein Peur_059950 [Populus x canadensis]